MSLELEEEWSKEKAAKQEAGRQIKPPKKSRKPLIIAGVGVALAAVLVVVVVLAGDEAKPVSDSADTVKVEIRAMPTAEIRVDGKKVGTTPMSLQYPKSPKQVTVEATMMRHLVKRGGTKDETYVDRRVITLERDRLLDFNITKAKLVETAESGKD